MRMLIVVVVHDRTLIHLLPRPRMIQDAGRRRQIVNGHALPRPLIPPLRLKPIINSHHRSRQIPQLSRPTRLQIPRICTTPTPAPTRSTTSNTTRTSTSTRLRRKSRNHRRISRIRRRVPVPHPPDGRRLRRDRQQVRVKRIVRAVLVCVGRAVIRLIPVRQRPRRPGLAALAEAELGGWGGEGFAFYFG